MDGKIPDPKRSMRRVEVLRIGHRPDRDKRITTHVSLVARAFGASSIHIDTRDDRLEDTVNRVVGTFGGDFSIRSGTSFKGMMGKWNGVIVHLTMYGKNVDEVIGEIPEEDPVLVVVGAEKVPREVYDLSHFNISVTNQPHSEVSALAIFLDRLFMGRELHISHDDGKIRVLPNSSGKTVIGGEADEIRIRDDPFRRKWSPVPGSEESMELLAALGCSKPVEIHVKEVLSLGMDMVNASIESGSLDPGKIEIDLLTAGLILHDIGRTRTHSVRHITEGVKLGRILGLDDRLIGIIHNHIGAGVTAEEAMAIGLPPEDHIPGSWEEKIVCHADSLVGSRRRKTLSEAVNKLREIGADAGADRMMALHRELEDFLGIDIDSLLSRE
ncbi:MAG: tRNA (cytidine(56)-2'-O)-methyltransferase [Thermoplasmatota archaeon]